MRDIFVARPFEGLADEPEWIALRELVPAASAPLNLKPEIIEEYGDRPVTLSTVLPMAWPAMTRQDGRVFIGLQRHVQSGDVSRDLAVAILSALQTEPGDTVAVPALPGEGPRLQDILVDGPLEITMHDGFEYWLDAEQAEDANVKASLERANASIYPTVRLAACRPRTGAGCAGQVRTCAGCCRRRRTRRWTRWPGSPPPATCCSARTPSSPGCSGRTACWSRSGTCRASRRPADWEAPLADFAKRYADILAETAPLDAAARRAKQGLVGRVTLR